MCAHGAHVAEEPDAVAEDGAAVREVGVPVLDQRREVGEVEAAQFVIEIAALRPLAREAAVVHPAEAVAAGLRNHVERRAAAVDFRQAAGDGDLHFRRLDMSYW